MVAKTAEFHQFQRCLRLVASLLPANAMDFQGQFDVLAHAAPLQQGRRLEDHAVVPVNARLVRRLPVDLQFASAGLNQIGDEAQQRGLAATGRAD